MKDFPIIKVTILFIFGILLQKIFDIRLDLLIYSTILLLLLIIIYFIKLKNYSGTIHSLFLFLILISLGAVSYSISLNDVKPFPFNTPKIRDAIIYGKINDIELERSYEVRILVDTDSVKIANHNFRLNNTFLCKLKDDKRNKLDSLYETIKIGNIVELQGTLAKGREKRNPGEFDYQKYLEIKGISGIFSCYNIDDVKIISHDYNSLRTMIFQARKFIDKAIDKFHNKETAGLLKGLILADRSEVSYETQNDFINTGVVHILAVSGSNVALILLMFQIFVGRFNVIIRSILTLLCLILFILITGFSPSVIRAAIMGIVIIVAFISNRSNNIYNSLALSALIILIINPKDLFDPGFQLSFSAVLSIIILVPFFQNRIKIWRIKNKIFNNIVLIILVSLAAQLGTLPFTLYYFGKLSIVSLLANLIVVPLIGIISGIGLFTLVLSIISDWTASIYAIVNELLSNVVFYITHALSGFKYSYLSIRSFSIFDAIIFYLLIALFFFYYERFKSIYARISLIILVFSNVILLCSLDDKKILPDNKLSVLTIDVGQGDAILLRFPDNKTALIDAGETNQYFDTGDRVIIPLLDYLGIEKIDYGFISHIDIDHYSGFFSLVETGKVKKIFKPVLDSTSSKDKKFERYLRKKNIHYSYYNRQVIKPDGARIYIFNKDKQYNKFLSSNNNSGIMKVVYGSNGFLFTGDAGKELESTLCSTDKRMLTSDVLKVSHHGSKYGTGYEFLSAVKPKISLISAGILNKFKHPSPETINRLKKANSRIYRTDEEGAILLVSDGRRIERVDLNGY